MINSGSSFLRCVEILLKPVRDNNCSFVDDIATLGDSWEKHCKNYRAFLNEVRQSGLTLNLQKCEFAKPQIKFVGRIVGSGKHSPDPDKIAAVQSIKQPRTKSDVRRIIGWFSYFRAYIPHLAEYTRLLSELLRKDKPNKIAWTEREENALSILKHIVTQSVENSLASITFGKEFILHVDASNFCCGACLTQLVDGKEAPVAFASSKFTTTQQKYAAVEREAAAVIWALNKFHTWIFGAPITIYSDSNPLSYLTTAAPKSAKLTRWALAISAFNPTFKYRKGSKQIVPDLLSRLE